MGGLTALLRAVYGEEHEAAPPPPAGAPDHHPALTPEEQAISPAAVMLAKVRAESPDGRSATEREILAELLGEERAAELIGEAVIVVDSAGSAVAPPAAKPAAAWQDTPASAADQTAAPAQPSAAEAPPEEPPPPPKQPPPPEQPRRETSAREPRRPTGFPEFDRFSAEKADQERAKKVEAARAQGRCQIGPEEAFPPDPREPPEVVRFTLAPGGRICRVAG